MMYGALVNRSFRAPNASAQRRASLPLLLVLMLFVTVAIEQQLEWIYLAPPLPYGNAGIAGCTYRFVAKQPAAILIKSTAPYLQS